MGGSEEKEQGDLEFYSTQQNLWRRDQLMSHSLYTPAIVTLYPASVPECPDRRSSDAKS